MHWLDKLSGKKDKLRDETIEHAEANISQLKQSVYVMDERVRKLEVDYNRLLSDCKRLVAVNIDARTDINANIHRIDKGLHKLKSTVFKNNARKNNS